MKKAIRDVSTFGGIDADADSLLDTCFQNHEAYLAAKEHKHFLIIGRKGSGKTAIFRKLITERAPDLFALGHTFAEYPWNHHDAQANMGVPEEERYVNSWKYLILLTTSKILLNQDHSQPWNDAAAESLQKIESFVVDSYGSRDPDVTQLFNPGKSLRINPTLKIALGPLEAGVSVERISVANLPNVVVDLNRTVSDAVIAALNPENSYHICFDQLDLGFSVTEPKYAQRLTGLILAARDLSQRAKAAGKKLSVDIFLRDDIYQLLKFEDKNKLSESTMSRIEWDGPSTEWTLRNLMAKRFAEVLGISEAGSGKRYLMKAKKCEVGRRSISIFLAAHFVGRAT